LADDEETPETALWRETVERLLANGSSPVEALDGANLILQVYRRQLAALTAPTPEVEKPTLTSTAPTPEVKKLTRTSGVRHKSTVFLPARARSAGAPHTELPAEETPPDTIPPTTPTKPKR
jgi:hypothetical protein